MDTVDTPTAQDIEYALKERISDALKEIEKTDSSSLTMVRWIVYEREVCITKNHDLLRVHNQFLTDPSYKSPRCIAPVYKALRDVLPSGVAVADVVTRDHMEAASEYDFLTFQLSNDILSEMFGELDFPDYNKFLKAIQSAFIVSEAEGRAFIKDNLRTISREVAADRMTSTDEIISYVERMIVASQDGIPAPLVDGTL